MNTSKNIYLIFSNDETKYGNQRQEDMFYHHMKNFINQKRFENCKVAIFE